VRLPVLIIVGLTIAASVAWFAAEQHYDSCVAAAIARTPLSLTAADRGDLPSEWDQFRESPDFFTTPPDSEIEQGEKVEDRPRKRRARALDGCSRLPS
jgi:hypothetical protein